jgi:two-component system, NarL family, sensor histidine kinase LiaS
LVREPVSEHRIRPRGLLRVVGGLRFRLILSYSLVTLASLATVGIVAAVTGSSQGIVQVDQADVTTILQKDAAAAASYLDPAVLQPDLIRLGIMIPVMSDLSLNPRERPLAAAVFSASGQLIAADSCTRLEYSQANSAACALAARAVISTLMSSSAARRAVLDAALGQANGQSISGTAARRGFFATPLGAPGRQSVGVLVVVFAGAVPPPAGQPFLWRFFSLLRSSWPHNWVPVLLFTMLIGTVTGLLLSHQLIRRLRAMASTVRVWSRGDLATTVDASGADELGRLGADLNHMAEQIRNLLEVRREVAMQQERNRVRRDLHDGVKQELFGISMQLATAKASLESGNGNGNVARHLEEAQRLGQRVQRELTAIIEELGPSGVRAEGLRAALAELTMRFERQSGIRVAMEAPRQITLPEASEGALFRVVQEALTNVGRHSAASRVEISLVVADGDLRLTVADDGHGLPAELADSAGLGLTTMRERVEALGGSFAVTDTNPGTCVEIAVPVLMTKDPV